MKPLLLLALILVSGLPQVYSELTQFAKMINTKTGKNALFSYGFYGCYCGYKGKGAPKDATDRCCARHDCCYDMLERIGCRTKTLKYDFTISGKSIICKANQNSCQRKLCECDKTAAECFAQNLKSYNSKLRNYPNWMCSGKAPSC